MVPGSSLPSDRQQGVRWQLPPVCIIWATVLALLALLFPHKRQELAAIWNIAFKELTEADISSATPSSAFCALELPPYVCAHGGYTNQHPPNTAAAYAAAVEAGADCIELDITLTADEQLITLHSKDLQQLLRNSTAQVRGYTLQQLLSTNWPSGATLLSVAAALELTAPLVKLVILDVKVQQASAPGEAPTLEESLLVKLLVQLLKQTGYSNILIWGKSDAVAQLIKAAAPGQRTGYTVMFDHSGTAPHFEQPLRDTMLKMEVAAVYHGMLDASLLGKLQSAGKSVFVWSVDEPADVTRMLDLGVHGLVTNKPKMVLKAAKERWNNCIDGS